MHGLRRLSPEHSVMAGEDIFALVLQSPAVQAIQQRVEKEGVLCLGGVSRAAQPFLAALLTRLFPTRPVVAVTEGVKAQESFHQDVETWLRSGEARQANDQTLNSKRALPASPHLPLPKAQAFFYPAWETLPHEAKLPHSDIISERLETLAALSNRDAEWIGFPTAIVTNAAALMQRTFAPEAIRTRTRTLRRGDRLDLLDLIEWLEEQGYEPEAQVTQKGEIASRGGILDVYPLTCPWPVRLEFMGDELESLRHFDPLTQLSKDQIVEVTVPPAGELGILKRIMESLQAVPACIGTMNPTGVAAPRESAADLVRNPAALLRDAATGFMESNVKSSASSASETDPGHRGGQRSGAPMAEPFATLIDHLPSNAIILLCESELLAEHALAYTEQVPANDPFFVEWKQVRDQIAMRGLTTLEVGNASPEPSGIEDRSTTESSNEIASAVSNVVPKDPNEKRHEALQFGDLDEFRPLGDRAPAPQVAEVQRRQFFNQLHRWMRQSYRVHVFCNNDGERQRFWEIWQEYGLADDAGAPLAGVESPEPNVQRASLTLPPSAANTQISTNIGALSRGFLFESGRLAVVTDAEIFGRYKVQRPRRLKSPHAVAARSALDIDFTELEEGDYVVHLQHGIGRYVGLRVLPVGHGRKGGGRDNSTREETGQECLVLEYASSDPEQQAPKLYVPVTEAHLVSKYVGAGKARPVLNTLGGGRWAKTKSQAEEAVRDLAAELLSIQAARESQPGHPFCPDTAWQREFEGAFLYEETPDQDRAIRETKKDMEAARPMDRLICGDVGYGKTEVALRAAFKAVMDGRQVAFLAPTTILTQQHYNTFRERMADYPFRVEQLSRFCSRRDQSRIIRELAAGAVDIVIGTHRLLQSDISFKDLGLVVIDEEQRFGVLHKEKFKRLRTMVDVLTLSATPIPRTLYLALTGARDMSTIETPPQDRLPVETIVSKYDERLIRDAIQRELNREGQVFYLHNRVFDIESVAVRIQALVPNARIIVGHGQMDSDHLEEVMARFVNGEADVLVCTTIIESGIDIPNANTIIIDRADRFGLSDLYQLRGRVGRYKHQAFAYLLLPRHASLLSDVRKRISAIRQYSSLGSGFKIAMRDLEIRGAGNLLGAAQSGHITAVGFELYCQLLKQSVSSLKGEKVKPRVEVPVRLGFLALSPGEEQRDDVRDPWSVAGRQKSDGKDGGSGIQVHVPRETAVYVSASDASASESKNQNPKFKTERAAAFIPFRYIAEARQRIEIYRKLSQVTDKASLQRIRDELRDRFGEIPRAVELLLQVTELKYLAAERGVTAIESKDDKLMLMRHDEYITLAGKFPRFAKQDAKARLAEIKRLILAL